MKKKKKEIKKSAKKENLNESKGGVLSYLKKIIKWQTIVGTISIITFAYFIYDRYYVDDLMTSKENIKKQINYLENDLNPLSLPIEIDTLPDIVLIHKFRKATLDACTFWKKTETKTPFHDFIPEEAGKMSVFQNAKKNTDMLCSAMFNSMWTMGTIYKYASENEVQGYETFDLNKHFNLFILYAEKDSIRKEYFNRISSIIEKDRKKAVDILDEMNEDISYYKFDVDFFNTAIEVNDIYKMVIRNYMYQYSIKAQEE